MLRMTHTIVIGEQNIEHVTEVSIKTSVENLSATAAIEIPATAFKRKLADARAIAKWQKVDISLGYDGENRKEFEGVVTRITEKEGGLLVECENYIAYFRNTPIPNHELNNPSVKDVLQCAIDSVNKTGEYAEVKLDCRLDYKYDKFVFQNCSAYDVLKKVQDETRANIYLTDWGLLTVVPRYFEEDSDEVRYSFQQNICKDGLSLTWRDSRTTKLLVEVIGRGKVGTTSKNGKSTVSKQVSVSVTAGEVGGDKITEKINGITDKKTLQGIADDMYAHRNYTGFEGAYESWLVPGIEKGDYAVITDEEDHTRDGKYYVKAVETSYGSGGGVRRITIGHKVK